MAVVALVRPPELVDQPPVGRFHSSVPAAEQMRQHLTPCKRAGLDFDTSWTWALSRVVWAHDTSMRRFEKRLIAEEQKETWRDAFENRGPGPPGGRTLLALWAGLSAGDTADVVPIRTPKLTITTPPDPRRRSQATYGDNIVD